jgi:hypothetical protein
MFSVPKTRSLRDRNRAADPVALIPRSTQTIDEHKIRTLRKAISLGNTFHAACALAEVDYDLCRRWMAMGGYPLSGKETKDAITPENAEEPYRSFASVMRGAAAEAENRAVQQIVNAGDRDWRASAFWLERQRPEDWAAQKEASVKVATTGGIQIFLPDNGRERESSIIDTEGTVIRELD